MSGVTLSPVPSPQQIPPGWLTSKATSPPETTPIAEPTTPTPGRVTSILPDWPTWSAKPSTVMKLRFGQIIKLSGNCGKFGVHEPTCPAPPANNSGRPAANAIPTGIATRPSRVELPRELFTFPPFDCIE